MPIAWRITKSRHDPWDGRGAEREGGRWNDPGRPVIYASDTYAGALLEILAHALRPRTLPGAHHAVRVRIPDRLTETLEGDDLPGWDDRGSPEALDFGNRWLGEARSAVLIVPSVPARPVGKVVMVNPLHSDAGMIAVSEPFPVPWDERLF